MELLQLRYFLTAAEYQHMTKAAEHLQIAQPALSQATAKYQKSYVLFRKLPGLYRQFGEMEREIQTLKSKQ